MPTQALPESDAVRDTLNQLLDKDITVQVGHPDGITNDTNFVVSVFEREDGTIGGICVADLSIAAYSAAAMVMLPKLIAEEAIEAQVLDDNLFEIYSEVVNISKSWFNGRGTPRVVVGQVYPPGERPHVPVLTVMAAPEERADFDVTVAGYGTGRIRLLATAY